MSKIHTEVETALSAISEAVIHLETMIRKWPMPSPDEPTDTCLAEVLRKTGGEAIAVIYNALETIDDCDLGIERTADIGSAAFEALKKKPLALSKRAA